MLTICLFFVFIPHDHVVKRNHLFRAVCETGFSLRLSFHLSSLLFHSFVCAVLSSAMLSFHAQNWKDATKCISTRSPNGPFCQWLPHSAVFHAHLIDDKIVNNIATQHMNFSEWSKLLCDDLFSFYFK